MICPACGQDGYWPAEMASASASPARSTWTLIDRRYRCDDCGREDYLHDFARRIPGPLGNTAGLRRILFFMGVGFVVLASVVSHRLMVEGAPLAEWVIVGVGIVVLFVFGGRVQNAIEARSQPHFMTLEWNEPWESAPSPSGFEIELQTEAGPGHPLFGLNAISVGRRIDNDDVLFFLPHHSFPFAVVHLTWIRKREMKPEYPHTELYASLEDWIEKRMKPDCAEF